MWINWKSWVASLSCYCWGAVWKAQFDLDSLCLILIFWMCCGWRQMNTSENIGSKEVVPVCRSLNPRGLNSKCMAARERRNAMYFLSILLETCLLISVPFKRSQHVYFSTLLSCLDSISEVRSCAGENNFRVLYSCPRRTREAFALRRLWSF